MTNSCRTAFPDIEKYMRSCMGDSAHDMEHVYRVLNYAVHIAKYEIGVNIDLLTAACLLHDIGRAEQFADKNIDHAACGAAKAYRWLILSGYSDDFSSKVKDWHYDAQVSVG